MDSMRWWAFTSRKQTVTNRTAYETEVRSTVAAQDAFQGAGGMLQDVQSSVPDPAAFLQSVPSTPISSATPGILPAVVPSTCFDLRFCTLQCANVCYNANPCGLLFLCCSFLRLFSGCSQNTGQGQGQGEELA